MQESDAADASTRAHGKGSGAARPRGLDLGAVLHACYREGLTSVLCEGGGVLASSLLREGRVQRLYLFIAPRTLGAGSVAAFPGLDDSAWEGWRPARPPAAFGRDLLWVLDRDG